MSGAVNFVWKLPATWKNPDKALDPSQVEFVRIEYKLKAAPQDQYTLVGEFAPEITTARVTDVVGGTWVARGTYFLVGGKSAPPVVVEFAIGNDELLPLEMTVALE